MIMNERIKLIKLALSVFNNDTDAIEMVGQDLPDALDYDNVNLRFHSIRASGGLWFEIYVAEEQYSNWTILINSNSLDIFWGTCEYSTSDWDIVNRAKNISLVETLKKIRDNTYTLYDMVYYDK